jgi:branched-chain amino acid transport system ATP-binding protein
MVGLDRHLACGALSSAVHGAGFRRADRRTRGDARDLLDLVGLADDADMAATALPLGKQRRLEIARALATRPKLLLLDEPAAGLRAAEVDALGRMLLDLRGRQRLTILLIDHVMALVMKVSNRVSVLDFGRKIAEGDAAAVRQSPEVIRAYLGERAAHAFGA